MPIWLKWETLGNTKLDFYGEEKQTSEGSGVEPASSKPPTPKAPITYWRDQQVAKEEEKKNAKLPKALGQKEKVQKEELRKVANPKGQNPKENIPKERKPEEKIQ